MSRQNGMTEAKIAGLADYRTDPAFTARERVALAYADSMSCTPVDVSGKLFDELRCVFSDVQIVELTSTIAWENYRARFNHALAIESDNFSGNTACPVPARLSPKSSAA